jgi:hypothetical protein
MGRGVIKPPLPFRRFESLNKKSYDEQIYTFLWTVGFWTANFSY